MHIYMFSNWDQHMSFQDIINISLQVQMKRSRPRFSGWPLVDPRRRQSAEAESLNEQVEYLRTEVDPGTVSLREKQWKGWSHGERYISISFYINIFGWIKAWPKVHRSFFLLESCLCMVKMHGQYACSKISSDLSAIHQYEAVENVEIAATQTHSFPY
jgi:hypothetical protein